MSIAKIAARYQITLPKHFREKFDLQPGDAIEITEQDGSLLLRPVQQDKSALKKHLRALLRQRDDAGRHGQLSDRALMDEIEQEIRKTRAARTR